MSVPPLVFRRQVIDPSPPARELDICLLADVNADGRLDLIIGAKQGDPTLFWYRNPDWERFAMSTTPDLEAGGVIADIAGRGRPDILAGEQWNGRHLYWFECPDDPTQPWTRRVVCDDFLKYHDQAAGDLDGDGRTELVFCSQRAGVLGYYKIPDDPFVEPWPESHRVILAEDEHDTEGLVIADVDGDGRSELIAGSRIYSPPELLGGPWSRRQFAPEYAQTRVAAGDLDGDGRLEIVLSEAETFPGRLAVCHAPDYQPRLLRDDLFHAHSLALADFDGDGHLDLFVGEMGLGRNPNPRLFIFRNDGRGHLTETVISEGVPVHEAKVGDLTGNGLPDIVGKPYHPECHVDLWINLTPVR